MDVNTITQDPIITSVHSAIAGIYCCNVSAEFPVMQSSHSAVFQATIFANGDTMLMECTDNLTVISEFYSLFFFFMSI